MLLLLFVLLFIFLLLFPARLIGARSSLLLFHHFLLNITFLLHLSLALLCIVEVYVLLLDKLL